MLSHIYLMILKIFMGIMPVCGGLLIVFAYGCIKGKKTDQPAFWYALIYLGIVGGEMLRGIAILTGHLPAHPKQVSFWLGEHLPLGGLLYELVKEHGKTAWRKLFTPR